MLMGENLMVIMVDLGAHAEVEGWNQWKEASDTCPGATNDWISREDSTYIEYYWDVAGNYHMSSDRCLNENGETCTKENLTRNYKTVVSAWHR